MGAVQSDAVAEPLLDCCHCGAVIGLQIWPPTEPVVSGLCPGCGGWLSVDFREAGQAVAFPSARPVMALAEVPGESSQREVIRPASRNRRSGTMDPLFLARLARQGKLLQIDNPATWKRSAPAQAAPARVSDRRLKFFGAAACLAVLLVGALFRCPPPHRKRQTP